MMIESPSALKSNTEIFDQALTSQGPSKLYENSIGATTIAIRFRNFIDFRIKNPNASFTCVLSAVHCRGPQALEWPSKGRNKTLRLTDYLRPRVLGGPHPHPGPPSAILSDFTRSICAFAIPSPKAHTHRYVYADLTPTTLCACPPRGIKITRTTLY
jgi:hypothetical protein